MQQSFFITLSLYILSISTLLYQLKYHFWNGNLDIYLMFVGGALLLNLITVTAGIIGFKKDDDKAWWWGNVSLLIIVLILYSLSVLG